MAGSGSAGEHIGPDGLFQARFSFLIRGDGTRRVDCFRVARNPGLDGHPIAARVNSRSGPHSRFCASEPGQTERGIGLP